ncbi:Protein of unknown function [Gryllus bimaculatus]|nr:Protein of unknown function [Gryllus bimaculatus]
MLCALTVVLTDYESLTLHFTSAVAVRWPAMVPSCSLGAALRVGGFLALGRGRAAALLCWALPAALLAAAVAALLAADTFSLQRSAAGQPSVTDVPHAKVQPLHPPTMPPSLQQLLHEYDHSDEIHGFERFGANTVEGKENDTTAIETYLVYENYSDERGAAKNILDYESEQDSTEFREHTELINDVGNETGSPVDHKEESEDIDNFVDVDEEVGLEALKERLQEAKARAAENDASAKLPSHTHPRSQSKPFPFQIRHAHAPQRTRRSSDLQSVIGDDRGGGGGGPGAGRVRGWRWTAGALEAAGRRCWRRRGAALAAAALRPARELHARAARALLDTSPPTAERLAGGGSAVSTYFVCLCINPPPSATAFFCLCSGAALRALGADLTPLDEELPRKLLSVAEAAASWAGALALLAWARPEALLPLALAAPALRRAARLHWAAAAARAPRLHHGQYPPARRALFALAGGRRLREMSVWRRLYVSLATALAQGPIRCQLRQYPPTRVADELYTSPRARPKALVWLRAWAPRPVLDLNKT